MECQHLNKSGFCTKENAHVPPSFCRQVCRHNAEPETRLVEGAALSAPLPPPPFETYCKSCEWYHACGKWCRLLTRQTNLTDWWQSGKDCPEQHWPAERQEPQIHPQPARHPARWKKIFMRHDGTMVDLIDAFHGQTVFLCCGGPSFGSVDKSLLARPGILTMAVNNTAHLFRPNLWTAQDPQYRFMPSIWRDPKIMKFTLWDYRRGRAWIPGEQRFSDWTLEQCPNLYFHKRKSDLDPATWLDEDCIVWGTPKELDDGSKGARSVFLAALHILYFLGFHKVYLLGVDFEMTPDKKYWFAEHRGPAALRNNARVFEHTSAHCHNLKPSLAAAGFNIFNCNPNSKLAAFPFYPFEKAIAENEISLADSTEGMYVERKK